MRGDSYQDVIDNAREAPEDCTDDEYCMCAFHIHERQAWAEDEADMAQIAREWEAFDRDPPGS